MAEYPRTVYFYLARQNCFCYKEAAELNLDFSTSPSCAPPTIRSPRHDYLRTLQREWFPRVIFLQFPEIFLFRATLWLKITHRKAAETGPMLPCTFRWFMAMFGWFFKVYLVHSLLNSVWLYRIVSSSNFLCAVSVCFCATNNFMQGASDTQHYQLSILVFF